MPKCLTCKADLKPSTSIPRWSQEYIDTHHDYYQSLVNRRNDEITNEKVGYLQEGQFCGVTCAAYFGRASVAYLRHVTVMPDSFHDRLAQMTRLIGKMFQYVSDKQRKAT